jgi:hypothetical protein
MESLEIGFWLIDGQSGSYSAPRSPLRGSFIKIGNDKRASGNRPIAGEKPTSRYLSHVPIWITVAVGTTIAGRPPHRSVRARLRIRLLPRMNGVEALVRIRMQNTWVRNPPVEQWVETVPSHLRALTATD